MVYVELRRVALKRENIALNVRCVHHQKNLRELILPSSLSSLYRRRGVWVVAGSSMWYFQMEMACCREDRTGQGTPP